MRNLSQPNTATSYDKDAGRFPCGLAAGVSMLPLITDPNVASAAESKLLRVPASPERWCYKSVVGGSAGCQWGIRGGRAEGAET